MTRHILTFLILVSAAIAGPVSTSMSDDGRTNYELKSIFDPPPSYGCDTLAVRSSGVGADEAMELNAVSDFTTYWHNRKEVKLNTSAQLGNTSNWQTIVVPKASPLTDKHSYSGSSSGGITVTANHRGRFLYLGYPSSMSSGSSNTSIARAISYAASALDKSGNYDEYSKFDTTEIPADWRAFTGFNTVTITGKEWASLPLNKQLSLKQYVHLGGALRVVNADNSVAISLGLQNKKSRGEGMGKIFLVAEPKTPNSHDGDIVNRLLTAPSFSRSIPDNKQPGPLTVLGVLALGILIGPVNLFVFTRKQRHKLFFTIPLIATVSSLVFVTVILMEDGIGGNGKRIAFVTLSPETASSTVFQQQASRCGALLGTSFSFSEPTLIMPISSLAFDNDSRSGATLSQTGTEFSGAWFKSRQKQVQTVSSVIPSRARIDVSAAAGSEQSPTRNFTNTTNTAIQQFAFVDAKMNYYTNSKTLNPGDSVTITAKTGGNTAGIDNVSESAKSLDSGTRNQLTKLLRAGGQIIAFADNAPELCIDTLDSVEWDSSPAVLIQAVLD